MSTLVFVDLESSAQADGAQISRVPVPLPEDPYEAIRSSYDSSPSLTLPVRKRYREDEGLAARVEGPNIDDESHGVDNESHGVDDESYGIDDEGRGIESDGLGLGEEEAIPKAVSAPLGLGYGALRRRELALEEDDVYSTFKVGQGSGSAPKSERPEGVLAFRQPTLTTWMDPQDSIVYIDILTYPPLATPIQKPPSPEWSSGSFPISPAPSIIPLPHSSPMIPLTVPSPVATPTTAKTEGFFTKLGAQVEMQGGLIRDHTMRLGELSPALFERYDRDIRELFTKSRTVKDERPVLALEAWTGRVDIQMVDMSRAGYDEHILVHD
nr:hypothetical protein [Tanacetum cinerariifolium]